MNKQTTYPAFLKAYPKVLGIEITDIVWIGIVIFFLATFQINPFWIMVVISALLIGKILINYFFQRNVLQLWLEGVTERDWKHLMQFKGL